MLVSGSSASGRMAGRLTRCVLLFLSLVAWSTAIAQTTPSAPAEIRGTVTATEGGAPVVGATVTIDERPGVGTATAADGSFALVVPGSGLLHLRVSASGFLPVRTEVRLGGPLAPLAIELQEDLHYAEAVTVGPSPRDPFESYQPTSVLSGQELGIKLDGSLGALLRNEPGVSERSLGPGPSRPVIRGQDGDRVLILQNSQRTADVSSQSGDHGVTINPAAATQVEVVRGPATLLYGANAIGGLVNVISNQIPTRPATGVLGTAQVDLATNAGQAGVAGDLTVGNGPWVLNVGASGRRSGDYDTPDGAVDNTQTRSGFANVGLSRTTQNGYLGAGVQIDDTEYGVPVVHGGEIELTPRRQVYNSRGELRNIGGPFTSVRGSAAVHRYKHEEVEGGEIGTAFTNNLVDLDLRATHAPIGRVTGTVGISGYDRMFEAVGEEALSPRVDQNVFSAFTYQEAAWSHATLQFGVRYDHSSFSPAGGLRPRTFDNVSFSLGTLFRPTEQSTLAVSFARAARNPALEELYFFGLHAGNFSFEVGNDQLDSEVSYGLDVSYRIRLPRVSAELSYFNNTVDNYIFRSPLAEEAFEIRFPGVDLGHGHGDEDHDDHDHDHADHGDEGDHGDHDHGDEELPIVEFLGRDVRLQGFEAHADVDLSRGLHLELGFDSVRASLRDGGDPLPRIPPVRFTTGLSYHWNALQVGGQVVSARRQDRVYDIETPTAGWTTVRLYGAYSLQGGPLLHTFTARLDNATNELYRNHLSLVKDLVPEMGRNFRVLWNVKF